ncbi:hypothetical protein AB0L63_19215 [Nocardia sp. NPDC051990]|uniref:hypothetical protein n=1 Tax=Nocardia sp. NPDC051990 TaxID=3155285 RepID=UPI003435DA3F
MGEEFEQVVSFGLDVVEGGLELVDVAEPLLGSGGVDAFGDVGLASNLDQRGRCWVGR